MKKPIDENAPSADMLAQQAGVWLRRLTSGGVRQLDVRGFQRWQQTSAGHRQAFEEAKRQWQLDQLMRPAIGELLQTDPDVAAVHQRVLSRPFLSRRAFLGAGLGVTAVAGIAALTAYETGWTGLGDWQADYRTATGEQRTVTLAENVNVMMNTGTRIQRQVNDGRAVGMVLLAGETAIDLTGTDKSFNVVAGRGRSSARMTRFDVLSLDDRVKVTCIDGTVQVEHPNGTRQLQSGQQTVYNTRAISGVFSVDIAVTSAWRRGELVFRQTPLPAVLAEINRYRPGHVFLLNTPPGDTTLSGSFAIAKLDDALLQIRQAFHLQARFLPGGVLILS